MWVSDGNNGVKDVPVTFTVKSGGGKVFGQDEAIVLTGITGHAEAQFTFGEDGGNNFVEAKISEEGLPVTFVGFAVVRDLDKPTTFTGTILDNANQAVGGALVALAVGGETIETLSNESGVFAFSGIPSGLAQIHVDGLEATTLNGEIIDQGSFPTLTFEAIITANAENTLPAPVVLPTLDPNNVRAYDGTEDVAPQTPHAIYPALIAGRLVLPELFDDGVRKNKKTFILDALRRAFGDLSRRDHSG